MGILAILSKKKVIYCEDKNSQKHERVMKRYKVDALTKKGAVLFAVCRGKVAEGMDLIDEMARCVIMVGIPYPSYVDHRV